MDFEYSVKAENKFYRSGFDFDEFVDPSDILKRLQTAGDKKLVSSKQKKTVLPVQKTASFATTNKSKPGDKLPTNERARQVRPNPDGTFPDILSFKCDHFYAWVCRRKWKQSQKTALINISIIHFIFNLILWIRTCPNVGSRKLPRNRLPKQERSDLPPGFTQLDNSFDKNHSTALDNTATYKIIVNLLCTFLI